MASSLPTGIRGRILAVAMTVLALAAIWTGFVSPVLDWYGDRAELLTSQRAMASHMAALVETLPALRGEVERLHGAGAADTEAGALLAGTSDPLAAASLQQRIDEFAKRSGVRIASEEILPAQPAKNLRAISVRLTMNNTPYRSLVALLLAVAGSETPMIADELLVRGSPGPAAPELPVEASLTVISYRAATPEGR
jgi:hypothetical protein